MSILRWLVFNFSYLRHPRWDTGISPPELIRFIDSNPTGRALDLGCGAGTNVVYMAKHGWQVTGVDFAFLAIRNARRKAGMAGIKADFRVADVTRYLQLPGPFDLILDIGCYHGLNRPGRKTYLSNVEQWLSPSGACLVYAFRLDKDQPGQPGLTAADIAELEAHFTIVERIDGVERSQRPSAWLTLKRTESPTSG